MSITEIDKTYVAGTYNRFPVEIAYGKGSVITDTNGKEYIDMGTGIGVNSFGICDDKWQEAVTEQLGKVQHSSNLYYTEPCAKLAELLCKKTGMKKVFFSNSGAEANECAIKVARKYAAEKKGEDYYTVITLENSFHGRTITTLSATGQDCFHKLFKPMTEGFVHTPANDIEALKKAVEENKTAAIMIECVQGEGGVIALDEDFLKAAEELRDAHDLILIIDEVQTGNGRTGEMYAYMNYNLKPDVVSTAKGLGGGLPIGATLLSDKVQNIFGFGDNGTTFGGNPVCSAGAISIVNRLTDEFLDQVKQKSNYVFEALKNAKGIESVSGLGLMIGIKPKGDAKEIITECINRGVICLAAKDKIRLLPALNIPFDTLKKAIEIIKQVIAQKE